MTTLDPDRTLALAYVPARHRPAIAALWALDAALGNALAGGREPMIARIKLVWWRDALEALDRAPAPAEPVLDAIAKHLLPRGVSGAALAEMERGWSVLTDADALTPEALDLHAKARGGRLFALSTRILSGDGNFAADAGGEVWALADLARHSGEPDRAAALAAARAIAMPAPWPVALRPLGMLAMLARRDAMAGPAPHCSPRRMARMLRHRVTGR